MRYQVTMVDKVVGLLAVLAILGCLGAVAVVGARLGWFEESLVLRTTFSDAAGLHRGAPVKLRDYPIGRVTKVVFNKQNDFDVEFEIFGRYADRIDEASYVQLASESFLKSYLAVRTFEFDKQGRVANVEENQLTRWAKAHLAKIEKKYLKAETPLRTLAQSGDFMPPVKTPDLLEAATRVITDFQKKIQPAADSMTRSAKHFEEIVADLSKIMDALATGQGTVGKFVTDKQMGEDIKKTIHHIDGIAGHMELVSAGLPKVVQEAHTAVMHLNKLLAQLTVVGEKAPAVVTEVEGIAANMNRLTANEVPQLLRELEQTMASANVILRDMSQWSADTPELVQSVQESLTHANEIMRGLKKSIFLRGLVEQEQQRSRLLQQGRYSRYEALNQP